MAVSKWERKALIPFGAASDVAREVGCSRAYVSLVIATGGGESKTARAVRRGLARRARVSIATLFPPEFPEESLSTPSEAPRSQRAA